MRFVVVAPGVDEWCFALFPVFNVNKWPKGLCLTIGWLVFLIELEFEEVGNG